MREWATSRFTGIFTAFDRLYPEPHDPAIAMYAGTLGMRGPQRRAFVIGGAGWDEASARGACIGEALERFEAWLDPRDLVIEASYARWPLEEPAIAPGAFALFTPEQHASEGFPFEPFEESTKTRWVAFRGVADGEPAWVPDAFAGLFAAPGEGHGVAPKISTGLAAGRAGDPVVLRALQEVIERDALVRAWWGELPLEAIDPERVFAELGQEIAARALRPHLRYRFYRVRTPHAAHAILATTEGEEQGGWVLSTGSAVRETRRAALEKALLEALQGRHYVRHQRAIGATCAGEHPADFAEHVLYYTLHPDRLARTVLARPTAAEDPVERERTEGLAALLERLDRPARFRLMTPRTLRDPAPEIVIARVVVPGLVPLHADHRLAHLGAPFWRERPLAEWLAHPPHPFA